MGNAAPEYCNHRYDSNDVQENIAVIGNLAEFVRSIPKRSLGPQLEVVPLEAQNNSHTIAGIFGSFHDLLGLVVPLLLPGRKILQQILVQKQRWDEPLSQEQRAARENWILYHIKIDRSITPSAFGKVKSAQLHHLSDANMEYGVSSYLRLEETENRFNDALVMGKSRVVPDDAPSIRRPELTAATVAREVGYLLHKESQIDVKEFFWTNWQVVFSYLNKERKSFHAFVSNRTG
eukprot:gene20760-22784_t